MSNYRPFQDTEKLCLEEDSDEDYLSGYTDYTGFGTGTDTENDIFVPPDRADLYRISEPKLVAKALDNTLLNTPYTSYKKSGAEDPLYGSTDINFGKTEFKTVPKERQTMILVDSLNRDRTAYPQPTSLQLHLPRVYRNITSIQIQQLKLLNSFLYFRQNKYNTYFDVLEDGRTVPGTGDSNVIRVNIREGSYSLDQLFTELTYQMNTTPTFYYFPNGFNDFVNQFSATGDLSLNFNLPGDYYYDSLIEKYISNPTIDYIVTRYFASRYIIQSTYSVDELQNAFYYPVLKEAFLDPNEFMLLTLPTTGEDVFTRVVFGFQGLDDPYTLAIIQANLTELDRYRVTKTFANSLVNKYVWGSNAFNKRVNVSAVSLNTSIVNDINTQNNIYTSNAILTGSNAFSTIGAYNNFLQSTSKINVVANGMYNYLQTQLATYFGVNIGTYSISTLADSNDFYFIQNGSNVQGVYTSYSIDYINARNSNLLLSNLDFNYVPSSPINQWPNMYFSPLEPTIDVTFSSINTNITSTVIYSADWLINSNTNITNNIYDYTLSNFDSNIKVTDSNGIVNASLKYGSADILANVSSGKYVIIPIRSDVRQLLQVETTSRPYAFRYKDFNAINYGGIIPFFFNREYEYNTYSSIGTAAGSNNIYIDINTSNYGKDRAEISSIGPFLSTYTLNVLDNYKYFQINMPQPPSSIYGTDAVGFDYQIQFEIANANLNSTINPTLGVFLYHDRAAFMADAGRLRSENPINYLSSYYISSVSSFTESIRVLGGNDYYLIVRPNEVSFETTNFNLYTYWNDATSTPRKLLSNFTIEQPGITTFSEQYGLLYADTPSSVNYFFYKTYNSNYIRLPINLETATPTDAKFNTVLSSGGPVIGYDDNDISNDLTDYKSYSSNLSTFVPGTQFAVDPTNLFFFNNLSPYNSTTAVQSYFYSGSSNAILTSTTLAPYVPTYSTVTSREYKIVHYYDPTFIGPQIRDPATGWSLSPAPCTFTTMSPYTSTTTNGYLSSVTSSYTYTYDSDIGQSTLKIGEGVYGITFLPAEGVYNVERFAFKSAYMGANDPNDLIEYIGIFDTNSVTNKSFEGIDLRGAFAVLKRKNKIVFDEALRASTANFDPSYGTWYNYELDTTFPYNRPDLIQQGLPGYTPYPCTIVVGEKNIYSAIPFKVDYSVTPYFMLTGSVVPFPNDSVPALQSDYNGFVPPNGGSMVVPTSYAGGIPYINNIYQSQYAQSMPIGTQGLNYGSTLNLTNDLAAMKNYNPVYGQVGDATNCLRTANYFEGSNHYLLFGDPKGIDTGVCDLYLVRNVGTSNRDTAFYSTLNLSNVIPLTGTENIVTWTANSDSVFALTRKTATADAINIYEISSLTSSPTCALHQSMSTNNMLTWYNVGVQFKPLFSTNFCKLNINDNKDWIYGDYIDSGDPGVTRGFIQYNNTSGQSTFTGGAYQTLEFRDIALYVNATSSIYTQFIQTTQTQDIQTFKLETTNNSTINTNGLIFTNGDALAVAPIPAIVPPYSFNVKTLIPNKKDLYVLSDNVPTRYLRLDGAGTPLTLTASEASFDPGYLATSSFGYGTDKNGGLWFSLQTGNMFASTPITIYGNSQLNDDIGVGMVQTAYQIFYPTMKMGLTRTTNRYNDIINTVDISYFNPPYNSSFNEYPRTQAFFYTNFSSLLNDVMSTNTDGSTIGWKWGQESSSNYFRADTEFQGFGLNSYIYNIPLSTNGALTPSTNRILDGLNGNPDDYSYLAIRSYSPSEDFQVMVRLNLPNRYDYGVVNNLLLIDEISTAAGSSALSNWNPNYVNDLAKFDLTFSTTQIYGAGVLSNFPGTTISTTNYSSFHTIFSTIYGQYVSNATIVTNINSTITGNLVDYLSTNYGEILPLSTLFSYLRITDALPFELQFSTSVAPQVANRDTDWGLGYNLGFDRSNYSNLTSYSAPTFYKILDDYIYLQLNESLSMNVLDTTSRENLSTTQESTGEVKKYFSKLLLGGYGNYSGTAIGTTVTFNPPVGKLDKFIFNWVDIDGNVIDNNDCDWSAVLLVNEQDQIATADSSLAKR